MIGPSVLFSPWGSCGIKAPGRHLKSNEVIGKSQYGFTKDKSCLKNLITFCDKAICLVGGGPAMGIVYADLSKPFDVVSHGFLLC